LMDSKPTNAGNLIIPSRLPNIVKYQIRNDVIKQRLRFLLVARMACPWGVLLPVSYTGDFINPQAVTL